MESCASTAPKESPVVELSVSGTSFVVLRSTLTETNWILARDIENVPGGVYHNGKFFIDADPISFRWVLQFVRCKTLPEEVLGSPKEFSALKSLADLLCFRELIGFIGKRERASMSLTLKSEEMKKDDSCPEVVSVEQNDNLAKVEENHKKEKGKLEEKNFSLKATNAQLRERLDALKVENDRDSSYFERRSAALEDRLDRQREERKFQKKRMEKENLRVQREEEDMHALLRECHRKEKSMENEIYRLQREVVGMRDSLGRTEADNARLQREVQDLSNLLQQHEVEKDRVDIRNSYRQAPGKMMLAVKEASREPSKEAFETLQWEKGRMSHHFELTLQKKNYHILTMDAQLQKQNNHFSAMDAELQKKNDHLSAMDAELQKKNDHLSMIHAQLQKKNYHLSTMDAQLQEQNNHLSTMDAQLQSFRDVAVKLDEMECEVYRCTTTRHNRHHNTCNDAIIVLSNFEHDVTIDVDCRYRQSSKDATSVNPEDDEYGRSVYERLRRLCCG